MSFPSHKAHRTVLISIFLALSQTPVYTVPVYAGNSTCCGYPQRDGQDELTIRPTVKKQTKISTVTVLPQTSVFV